ncbi:MAG: hypothetical protein QOJ54_1028 [Aliidongia sp.]|jgi:predicted ATPase/DNA-binding winged helix-turn-helix (wHTH) protein|nr:hypothetical protein [Aliidongia sp.]
MRDDTVIGYAIGQYSLMLAQRQLLRGDEVVDLPTRAFDTLAELARMAGTVVGHEALFRATGNAIYRQHAVVTDISAIRRAIGADAIATMSGRGYQLTETTRTLHAPMPATGHALPRRPARLVGRDQDKAGILSNLLPDFPVTLTGTSGIGKTVLAIELAWTLAPDMTRIALIDLSSLTDPASIIGATAAALGLALRRAEAAIDIIAGALGGRSMLIFDGCEHLAPAAHELIEALRDRVPSLTILATSQCRLNLRDETAWRLDPLAPEDAKALVLDRARALDRHFDSAAAEQAALDTICRRLDCIPAALEIAAANLPLIGLAGIATALDTDIDLRHPGRAGTRHASPGAMAEWAYHLLIGPDQRIFRAISAIPASFDIDCALAVIGGEPGDRAAGIEALGRLAERSMIVPIAGPIRYRLLEAQRRFGREARRAAGEDEAAMTRLATYLIQLGHAAETEWEHAQAQPFLARYRPELDTLIALLDWALAVPARAPIAIRLAGACGRFFNHFEQFVTGRDYLSRAAAAIDDATPPQDAALALRRVGGIWHTADRPLALRYLRRSEACYRQSGDQIGLGRTLSLIGDCLTFMGDHPTAQIALEEALAIVERSELYKSRCTIAIQLGRNFHLIKNFVEAERHYTRGLEVARRMKDPLRENLILINIAEAKMNQGLPRTAIDLICRVVAALRDTTYRSELGHAIVNLASYRVLNGETARADAEEALDLAFEEGGYWLDITLQLWALIGALDGRRADAATLIAYVDLAFPRRGDERQPLEIEIRQRIARLIDGLACDTGAVALWTENDAVAFCRRNLVSRPLMTAAAD